MVSVSQALLEGRSVQDIDHAHSVPFGDSLVTLLDVSIEWHGRDRPLFGLSIRSALRGSDYVFLTG